MNMFLRLLGAKIGKRVTIQSSSSIVEPDLVTIGDGCVIEQCAGLQPHTFEGRVMACREVRLGNRVFLGSQSVVLAGAVIERDSHIESLTLIMKNQVVPASSTLTGGMAVDMEFV